MFNTTLKIEDVVTHKSLQAPDRTSQEHIEDIREAIEKKDDLPRVKVMEVEGVGYVVTDGHHTLAGAKAAGRKTIAVSISKGTMEDARLEAAKANQKHLGLKRSHKTKRWATMTALEIHPEWSDGKVAKEVGVSPNLVAACRKELPDEKKTAKRVGSDGKARTATPKKPEGKKRTPSEALAAREAEAKAGKDAESPTVTNVKAFNWSQHDQCFGFLKRGLEALMSLTGDRDAVKKADAALNAYLKHADQLKKLANGPTK